MQMNMSRGGGRGAERGARGKGFTLIETIGALAVLAVLAATLLPAWIKRIDMATRNQEKARLGEIRDSLGRSLVRGQVVPDHATWSQRAAEYSALPISRISANARHYQRVYYALRDPSVTLPYTQDAAGMAQPQRLRAVVVSVLGGAALNAGNSPAPGVLDDAEFAVLWDLPEGALPTSGQWTNWNGRGDDFLVSRVDYGPMFHRLVLVNRDPKVTPTFTIEGSSPIALLKSSPNTGLDSYYASGTMVGLCDATGTPETRYLLTRDISFVFEHGMWRAQIVGGTESMAPAEDFSAQAAQFLASSWWTGAAKGADQQTALVAMYAFMLTYTFWADLCPHFPLRTSSDVNVPEYKLLLDYGGANARLDAITGPNGLLNK